jgi:hypothetical protein
MDEAFEKMFEREQFRAKDKELDRDLCWRFWMSSQIEMQERVDVIIRKHHQLDTETGE